MARFTFSNQFPTGTPGHVFIGFDDLGGEITEATDPAILGKRMPPNMRRTFEAMRPGEERRTASGNRMFREF